LAVIIKRRKGMKKIVFVVLLALLWTVSVAATAELKVGDKAADFDGKGIFTE
jgi:hypothetical protein